MKETRGLVRLECFDNGSSSGSSSAALIKQHISQRSSPAGAGAPNPLVGAAGKPLDAGAAGKAEGAAGASNAPKPNGSIVGNVNRCGALRLEVLSLRFELRSQG